MVNYFDLLDDQCILPHHWSVVEYKPSVVMALLLGSYHLLSSQVNPVALTTSFSDPISLGSTLHYHLL